MENVHVQIPENALEWLGINSAENITFTDKLGSKIQIATERATLPEKGLILPALPPNTPLYLEID